MEHTVVVYVPNITSLEETILYMITSKLDKTNQEKKKSPRRGTKIRDPVICTLMNPIKTLEAII